MPQRLAAIFLVLIFAIGIGGYYPFFKLEQWHIRSEMKERIKLITPQQALKVIEVKADATSSINWDRPGQELWYNGRLYDVVSTDTLCGIIRFHCLTDFDEEALMDKFDAIDEEDDADGSKHRSSRYLIMLAGLLYLPGTNTNISVVPSASIVHRSFETISLSGYSTTLFRPPSRA